MRQALRLSLAALAALLALPAGARTAFAHGGQYRGPAGEVPPDSRQPFDPPPPDTGNGTPTPPDTGPGGTPTEPPGDGPGTPTPKPEGTPDGTGPGGPVPPPVSGPGSPTGTRRLPARRGPSFESWLFWWNYNKDGILDHRRARRGASTGGLADMAEGGAATAGAATDLSARLVEARVVPFLERVAADSRLNFDIQASGVLGLAKAGRRQSLPLLMKYASNGAEPQVHRVVEETAALALGVMQDRSPAVREFLRGRIADAAARTRTRCFAAFSLGLLGEPGAPADPRDLAALRDAVTDPGEASGELAASALSAMGLLGDPAAIPDLLAWLGAERAGTRRLDDVALSCAAASLGRIGRTGLSGPSSREVLDGLRDQLRRKHRATRWSAIIALGQIAPGADEALQAECVSHLGAVVAAEGRAAFDSQAVNFALVALGRVAGAPAGADGRGACPAAVRDRAVERLARAFDGKPAHRSFAALGLGLAGMDSPGAVRGDAVEAVRLALARATGDAESRGALCISLGLLRDGVSAGMLRNLVAEKGLDSRLRGAAALGLGLMGDRGSLEVVRAALLERGEKDLRVDAAQAAGLLGDDGAVESLAGILGDPKSSQVVLGSVAAALGRIGDGRAVGPLLEIAANPGSMDLARALACTALGQIADRSPVPVLSRVSRDVNYRAYYDAVGELLTIL